MVDFVRKVQTSDLAVGMQFPVCGVDVLVDSDVGSYEDGFFCGWVFVKILKELIITPINCNISIYTICSSTDCGPFNILYIFPLFLYECVCINFV